VSYSETPFIADSSSKSGYVMNGPRIDGFNDLIVSAGEGAGMIEYLGNY
jgi:hypothetical protein